MDSAAHGFSGREEEDFRITLDWLKRHGFNRQPQPNKGMPRIRNTVAFLNSTAGRAADAWR